MVKKKPATPPHEEHADETWLVPYSDLLTLLMALFIVLFASSSLDKNKAAQIQYALAAAFGGGIGMEDNAGGIGSSFSNDAQDLNLQEDGVIISSDANGATLEMTSINLFDKGSVILRPEAIPVIKKISLLLNSSKYKKYRIVVEGHTDDTNESDTLPSNWELSAARAGAVVRAMINNDMEVSRFKAVGLAEISPAYPNLNPYGEPIPENRLKNRRVIVRIEF
jgi:chemotaxis protein MotB